MNISKKIEKVDKKIEKVEKKISKYIFKSLKLPKSVKHFVKIQYCSFRKEFIIFYNAKYIGKVGLSEINICYSKRELIEKIIKNYASELALSNLKE